MLEDMVSLFLLGRERIKIVQKIKTVVRRGRIEVTCNNERLERDGKTMRAARELVGAMRKTYTQIRNAMQD
jgi:hypothetical protein